MEFFEDKAQKLIDLAKSKKIHLATAESCTGGLISAAITSIPGSSEVFQSGFVTYSNLSKHIFLKVSEDLMKEKGSVSVEVAKIMAVNACLRSRADMAVSVTGIAGPGGATEDKPIGLIYIGFYSRKTGVNVAFKHNFEGNRNEIRKQTVAKALDILIDNLSKI